MAVKAITIDMEAYEILVQAKNGQGILQPGYKENLEL